MRTRRNLISGFSLVEVVIALAVFVFALLTILGCLATGMNSSQISTNQTTAINILTAVVADLQSTPNPLPKGSSQTSPIYGITLPTTGTATSGPSTLYLGSDGTLYSSASGAAYQLSVWTTGPTTTKQETLVRLLLTWPATVAYQKAQGSVETMVALNRT